MSALGYSLLFLVPLLLVTAQSIWRSAVVNDKLFSADLWASAVNVITNPKIWLGGMIYLVTTFLYLLVLSKTKFFSAQMVITSLAVIFSALVAYFIFQEKISALNLIGVAFILAGIFFVVGR